MQFLSPLKSCYRYIKINWLKNDLTKNLEELVNSYMNDIFI